MGTLRIAALLAVATIAIVVSPLARAGTITQFSTLSVDFLHPFDQFNPSLGILSFVEVSGTVNLLENFSIVGQPNVPYTFTQSGLSYLILTGPSGFSDFLGGGPVSGSTTMTFPFGSDPVLGLNATGTFSDFYSSPSDLAPFEGTGTYSIQGGGSFGASVTPTPQTFGPSVSPPHRGVGGSVTVLYFYTIPEPPSVVCAALAGLIGLVSTWRRRKARLAA